MPADATALPNYETLLVTLDARVLTVRLNRPQRLNAVVEALYQELLDVLRIAQQSPQVRAVVLTGEGRAFCVGADMKAHGSAKRTLFQRRAYLQLGNDVCEAITKLSKPVVAAVNGYALGAGAEMAVSCGVSKLLPQLVGLTQARRLLYLGDKLHGPEAAKIGLALASYPQAQLMAEAQTLAERLAKQAPVSMAMLKPLVNRSAHTSMESQLQQELDAVFTCSTTEDWQEGVDAFAERRPPNFQGQ